ncbi:MAG: TonB-dependent receptor [Novosphingobium sp.]
MNIHRKTTLRLEIAALPFVLAGLMASTAAQAQGTPAPAADTSAEADVDAGTIIVTGSRIARPNGASAVPITTASVAELTDNGKVAIGDTLNDLPSLRTTFSQTSNTSTLGTTGLNLLDLRGLGTQRTLVLVNGRRHVAADILNNGVSVDINTIPTDLIERVDIITGGSSAVYGSDAIAGAVNFILKRNFTGVTLKGQAGISSYGDAGSQRLSITAGTNFADGRGNIAGNFEYTNQNPFFASGRPYLAAPAAFVVVETDPGGSTNGAAGGPDRLLFNDVRSATLALGGLSNFGSKLCGKDVNGAFYDCTFLFGPDGTLAPQTGTRVGLSPGGSFLGGNGSTNREGELLGLLTKNERYVGNVLAHYEFSPAAEFFFEGKYARSNTLSVGSGPAFIQGTTLSAFGGNSREKPRLDNPYLTTQAHDLIVAQLTAAGQPILPSSRFNLRENLTGLGNRQEAATRETWRAVAGLRGDLSDNWKYEISGNYGEFKERTKVLGNMNVQRFLLAWDSAKDNTGKIVCRSQIDPTAAVSLTGNAAAATRLAGDVAACVPINLFGEGNVTQAARNYINQDTVSIGKITQFDVTGFVSGDTGKFFNLPGGPIGIVLGGEYRRETNYYTQDQLIQDGMTFYNSIPTYSFPAFTATEAFGEIRVPILKDVPFFQTLEIGLAGRVSKYGGNSKWQKTYNFNVEWAPVEDIRFRAAYARSLRAPNLQELYTPNGQNFAGSFSDPCANRNLAGGTSTRAANCAAAGRPTGTTTVTPNGVVPTPNGYDYAYTASLLFSGPGGNPKLNPEFSDSYTAGVVLKPRYVPGLTLSVDYYNIKVNRGIATVSAQNIVNLCYDSPTLANVYCGQFKRNLTSGFTAAGEEPFRIIEGSLTSGFLNFSKFQVRGIDVDLNYEHQFNFGKFSTHLVYTHVLTSNQNSDPSRPNFNDQILGETGDPQDSFNWSFNLKVGKIGLGYQLRYLGKQLIPGSNAENVYIVNGAPPQNADYSSPLFFPSVFYHSVKVDFEVNEKFDFYVGVDNIMDKTVPYDLLGAGSTSSGGAASRIYDNKGRFFYAGATAKF